MTKHSPDNSASTDAATPLVTLPCIHCGESTECASDTPPNEVFCCRGCVGAYQLIHGLGLEDFYALREQTRIRGTASRAAQAARYDQFDEPEFLGCSTPSTNSDGTHSTTLALQGLHCAACSWLIESAARSEVGLLAARVKMSDHTIRVTYDPQQTKLSRIARLLDRLGYQASPFDPSQNDHLQLQNRSLLIQIAIAGFLAANAMWIAIALYAGGAETEYGYFLGLMGTALGVTAVLGPGRTFLVGAMASLKTYTPHMDLPVALGLLVGGIVGAVNAVRGIGHVYFDSIATLVFLLLIGRWIQFHQQQRAAKAVDLMLRLTPRHATLVRGKGERQRVLSDTLTSGDIIEVASGESVPADGTLVGDEADHQARGKFDCSLLSGESRPVALSTGDSVAAGVVNLGTPVRVSVTATGRESRIGQIMQSVESATTERTPIVMLADRIGGYFVVIVTMLAVFTFAWWLHLGVSIATEHATSLLIVACPCALALATPLAIAVGLGRAARRGILIRDGKTLQQLARPGRIWFDKTGTLTEGRQRITTFQGPTAALAQAAALERQSQHPVATALIREAQARKLDFDSLTSKLTESKTGGVLGQVGPDAIAVGNLQFTRECQIAIPDSNLQTVEQLASRGESPNIISVNGQVAAIFGLSDPVRNEADTALAKLKASGWEIGMLSGDHPSIATRVGLALGIANSECFGGLTPEEKLAAIRQSRTEGKTVVMVGDGANDAAALAAADVGIAVRGGAEVSLQAAPVFVASGKLPSVAELVNASGRTSRLIMATFLISLSYNAIAVGLAMAGFISPLVAAVLMPISSVSVLAITLGKKTFESNFE